MFPLLSKPTQQNSMRISTRPYPEWSTSYWIWKSKMINCRNWRFFCERNLKIDSFVSLFCKKTLPKHGKRTLLKQTCKMIWKRKIVNCKNWTTFVVLDSELEKQNDEIQSSTTMNHDEHYSICFSSSLLLLSWGIPILRWNKYISKNRALYKWHSRTKEIVVWVGNTW